MKTVSRRTFFRGGGLAVLAAFFSWFRPNPTPITSKLVFNTQRRSRLAGSEWPTDKAFVGITDDDRSSVESATGLRHKLLRRFMPNIDRDILSDDVKVQSDLGRLYVVSFKPIQSGRVIRWQDFLNGYGGDWVRRQAGQLKAWGGNIIIAPFPEPEGGDEYVKFGGGSDRVASGPKCAGAFRRFADAVGHGANVRYSTAFVGYWVDEWAAGRADWMEGYYPGPDAVDYIGSDPYVWCAGSGHGDPPDRPTFAELTKGLCDIGKAKDKPVGLCEYGYPAESSRAAWLDGIDETLGNRNRIKFTSWFANLRECDWRIQDSASLSAWKRLLLSPEVALPV